MPIVEPREPAAASPAPPVPPDPDPAERPRTSRRRLGAPLVVLTAIAIIAGLVASGQTPFRRGAAAPTSRPGPGLDGYTVVYTGKHGVEIVPLHGHRHLVPLSTDAGPPVRTAAGMAFVRGGIAYLLAPPYDGPPRPLVTADGLFPMVSGDMVGADRVGGPGGHRAMYVNLDGTGSANFPEWQLPPGYQPVGQFFAIGQDGLLRGWSPGPGGQAELGPVVGQAAAVVGTVGSSVVWLAAGTCAANGECTLHVSTSDYPRDVDHVVPPARGHEGFLPGGAVDPDGTRVAAFVAMNSDHAALAIVDYGILDTTLVPGSTIALGQGVPTAQWTPDDAYVLFSGPGGAMHAYAPGSSGAVSLDIMGSSSFSVG